MGSKIVILSDEGYVNTRYKSAAKRRALIKWLFSMAAQHNWEIRMKGQHW
jgi:hypothetical protein